MTGSKTLKSKKHSKETYYKRREYEGNKKTISESHYYKSVVKEGNRKVVEEQQSRKKTKDNTSRHVSQPDRHKRHESKRREKTPPPPPRRNYPRSSPEQLVCSGSRNTDSNSSNESEEENQHKKSKHKHKSKSHKTESYEELSRRKRKIESELHALDMEEAAQKQAESKKSRRDVSEHHKKKKPADVYIKEEPVSDEPQEDKKPIRLTEDEHRHKRKHLASQSPNEEKDWGKQNSEFKANEKPKEKPNFSVSGKLAEDTNTYNGVVIKYNEPAEARKARRKWRLYPFKGDTSLPFIPIHRQSAYLFGRTRLIADIPIDHPSCSKQHAVLQFRMVSYKRDDGSSGKRVRPYIIDLESSNGTFVNNKKVEPRRYIELMEKDVVKFGFSSREYVILHEESQNDFEDDDVTEDKSE